MIGQANLHRRADGAAALANHIYYQMGFMRVTSPGTSTDRCQNFKPNPRRMGLPRTVTEWKINRAREIQSSLVDGNHSGQSELHEIGEPTAFEIIKSREVPAPTRRSLRIENRQASRPGTSKGTRPSSILPTLTLSQSDSPPLVPTGNKGEACSLGNPDSTQNLSRRKSEGHSPEAFVFALQEPPMVGNKLVNIKNVIQIVYNKCLERNPPVDIRHF